MTTKALILSNLKEASSIQSVGHVFFHKVIYHCQTVTSLELLIVDQMMERIRKSNRESKCVPCAHVIFGNVDFTLNCQPVTSDRCAADTTVRKKGWYPGDIIFN
jgi:hypothetical protein